MRHKAIGSSGFTLTEVLIAIVILGVVSLAAARLYVTTVGVQHKLNREFDLRQDGLRVLNEIGRGFTSNSTEHGGVHGASKVELGSSSLELEADDTSIEYTWVPDRQILIREIGAEPAESLLDGVEHFAVACDPSSDIILVRLTLVAAGKPQPRVEVSQSLRPRVAKPKCN